MNVYACSVFGEILK